MLPIAPPVEPMLARLARALPAGDYLYEPKWDGFRCLAFAGDDVELRSRHDRPLARYFPELAGAMRGLDAVLDGEIVGRDFSALLGRLHPAASRVTRLVDESPAWFVAFDVLAARGRDLTGAPFRERRALLEELLAERGPRLVLTPATDDVETAADWLERFTGRGLDGVVAKPTGMTYQPGRRVMVKVKRERTADCVVAGVRPYAQERSIGSLLLGLHDEAGVLRHVGVCSSFSRERRRELGDELRALLVPLAGHPWEHGFGLGPSPTGRLPGAAGRWDPSEMSRDWLPVAPARVVEVAYDQLDGRRFRHAARFVRWRPDREPASCTFDQLAIAVPDELLALR